MTRHRWLSLAAMTIILTLSSFTAKAADLVIGMQGVQTAVDPHWMTTPRNWTINHHIFEPLVRRSNKDGAPEPWLAESWKRIDDVTWEFKLRKNVKWHDGTNFTADDVLFTYKRAPNVPKAPTPFIGYVKYFAKVEAPDPYTVRITTKGPAPALLHDIAYLLIVQKKASENATTADFNSGKAAIGTGAYKLVSFEQDIKTVVKRNPDYWGEKEPWDTVTFQMLPGNAARMSALLTGDIQVLEAVPTSEIDQLKKNPDINIYTKPTGKIAYLALDIGEEALKSGRVASTDGKPLSSNPLADKRVRTALKISVDFQQIAERIYQDQVLVTGQYLLPGVFGYDPEVKPWKADEAKARKLLEESGWAGKLKIELGVSDRTFQNALATAQAIAQAWSRIGVEADVTNMPYPVFLKARNQRKMPVFLMTRTNSPLVADTFYPVVIHSRGEKRGSVGGSNYARYSNPEVDELIKTAMKTMDEGKREKLYQKVGRIAIDDTQITPLFLVGEATATQKNIAFVPRFDRQIYAMNIREKK